MVLSLLVLSCSGGSEGWHIFYHFVGAIPGSTDPEKMLRRLLRELKICNDSNMPKNLEAAAQLVSSVLSNLNTRPTIMIIDALNQAIVTEMLGQYNKRLDAEQMSSLLSKNSSQNPLWLAIACEELRVYGEFSKVTDKINSLQDGLLNLLAQVFDRFEEENGGNLLTATLCLLEASQTGLLEVELLSILGDEDNLMPSSESSRQQGESKAVRRKYFNHESDDANSEASVASGTRNSPTILKKSQISNAKWSVTCMFKNELHKGIYLSADSGSPVNVEHN
ncbi:putative telomerase protein component 1 [Apostichopus japonicus]|uniref:Putative telomerase protein component 1 n=1 Tax=Stichopus japonicus TaxID=307972 RepID=A0A2G8JGW7_STIJA|nr:putative telomerase protein component 1 [Apostichopus japonicus]